jgi:thioredoxin 1
MQNKMLIPGLMVIIASLVFAFMPKSNRGKIEVKNDKNSSKGIRFIEEDWNKALHEAKEQHKLIFLDAYASWCGPCKMLKALTFPNKDAGEFFNANFINVAVDMEQGYGPALSQKFAVNAYPTLVIANAEGEIVAYTQGYMNAKQLIKFGEYGLARNK